MPITSRMSRAAAAAVGGLAGLTWAAGFRGYMAALAGPESKVTWYGTFVGVLLPATAVGALFGWSLDRQRRGEPLPHRAGVAAAPVAIGLVPLTTPGVLKDLAKTGQGSAAGAVALAAIGGGYALAGRGPAWSRITTGAVAAAVAAAVAGSVPAVSGKRLPLTTPRGALTAVLGASSVLTLALAAAVPFRGRDPREG